MTVVRQKCSDFTCYCIIVWLRTGWINVSERCSCDIKSSEKNQPPSSHKNQCLLNEWMNDQTELVISQSAWTIYTFLFLLFDFSLVHIWVLKDQYRHQSHRNQWLIDESFKYIPDLSADIFLQGLHETWASMWQEQSWPTGWLSSLSEWAQSTFEIVLESCVASSWLSW